MLAPSSGSAWLPSSVRLPIENGEAGRRQAIRYRDANDDDDDESVRAEVDRLNTDSNLASRVEGERSRPNGPWGEHEHWRAPAEEA